MKLGLIGVTILVSTGDDGVSGSNCLCEQTMDSTTNYATWSGVPFSGKGYFPSFPATSPYVVAVGATMGPQNGSPEVQCTVSNFFMEHLFNILP